MNKPITRIELITKGERQLSHILKNLEQAKDESSREQWARVGINMLDMLSFLLDEEFSNYNQWFDSFFYYK